MKELAILGILWEQHFPILIHYLKNLPDSYGRTIYLLYPMDSKVVEHIKALGHKVVFLNAQILSEHEHRAVKKSSLQTLSQLRNTFSSATWQSFCEATSIPDELTAKTISENVSAKLEIATSIIKMLDKIQQTGFIEMILVSEDVTHATRAAIAWGKREKIPSLHLQHGPVMGLSFSVHIALFADHMAVCVRAGILFA